MLRLESFLCGRLSAKPNFRNTDQERTTHTGRIDIDFTDKDTFAGVYSWNLESQLRTDRDPTFNARPEGSVDISGKLLSLTYRRVISSNLVNELRGSFFLNPVNFLRGSPDPADVFSLPLISNPENTTFNQGRYTKNYNIQNNVDWIKGKHNIRFGGQLQFFLVDAISGFDIATTYSIDTSSATSFFTAANFANIGGIRTPQVGTANGLLGLLGGIVSGVSQQFYLNDINSQTYTPFELDKKPFRYENHSVYVSDRWQVTKDFTLSLGLRYELFPALRQINGVALEPALNADDPVASIRDINGRLQLIGGNAGRENAFYKTDYNNFPPSIGFAWAPKFESGIGRLLLDRTVLRGGYSRVYGNDQIVTAINQAAANNQGLGF